MSLKAGIFSNVLWRSLQIVSTLVLNILVARYLGAAGSGSFFFLITIYTLYLQIGSLSLESAIGFFTSNKQIPVSSLAMGSIAWTAIVTLAATLIFGLIHSPSPVTRFELVNMAMFMAGNLLTNYYSGIFFSMMNFKVPNLTGTIINFILTIFLAILLATDMNTHHAQVVQLFFFSFLVRGLIMVCVFYSIPANRVKPILIKKSQAASLLRYSMLAYAANLVFFILYRVDYFFVQKYCSASDLGNYIQVCRIAQMFFLFPSMIATVIFPLSSSSDSIYIRTQLPVITRVLFYTFLAICAFLCLTGYWIFPFVFGNDFTKMYGAFLWLVPGMIALAVLYPFTAYYSGMNQVGLNIKGSVFALAVIVVGDLLVIPTYGINGAAAISSAGYITYQLFIMSHFKRTHQLSSKEFFYFKVADFRRIGRSLMPR